MKIYLDVYLAKNLGDDLFVDIIATRFPDIDFYVNYYGKEYDEFIKKYKNLHRPNYPLIYRITNKLKLYDYINDSKRLSYVYDGYIFLGGSIFREEKQYWRKLYNQRYKILDNFKRRNKPVLVLGSNFGPVYSEEFVNLYTDFFKKCNYVCFRDTYSYDLFKSLKSINYAQDIIFQKKIKKTKKENEISYSIIDPKHKEKMAKYENYYIDTMTKSVLQNISKGIKCNLLSFCKIEGDLEICNKIYLNIPDKYKSLVSIYNYDGDIDFFMNLISKSSLIIACRFHANILGIITNTPIIPIVYSEKTPNVLIDLKYKGEIFDISNFDKILEKDYITFACKNDMFSSINLSIIHESSKKQFSFLEKSV